MLQFELRKGLSNINGDVDISSGVRCYPGGSDRHRHDYIQVVVPIDGRMDLRIDGQDGHVVPGGYAVIPPGAVHIFEATLGSKFVVIDAGVSAIKSARAYQSFMSKHSGVGTMSRAARNFFHYFVSATENDKICNLVRSQLALSGLHFIAGSDEAGCRMQGGSVPAAILTEIERGRECSMQQLAERHGLSRSVMYRRFLNQFGHSAKQHEIRRRMQKARILLEFTEDSISTIAEIIGYSNTSSFSSIFMRTFGRSPAAYRKEQKAKS